MVKAREWFLDAYPAEKVLARLLGVYSFIPWHEFESRSVLEMYGKRKTLTKWIQWAADNNISTQPRFAGLPTNRAPYTWLIETPPAFAERMAHYTK